MFVSRPQVFHGEDYRTSSVMTDARIRAPCSLVASNTHTITTHTSDVTCLAFSATVLATCSSDRSVRLWGAKDFSELASSPMLGHTYMIHCCAFSPLGSVLATCSTDGTLRLWDVKTGETTAILAHPSKCAIRVCQFSSDGKLLVTGGDDDTVCLWNVADKKLVRSFKGHDESVMAATFTPDGHYVVSGSSGGDLGGDLLVWDALYGHGKALKRVADCHDLGVACCQFSPTYGSAGQPSPSGSVRQFLLATGGKDNLVKLWMFTAEVGSVNVTVILDTMLPGHTDSVLWLAFSPDGTLLTSCSLDKTARLWNVETKQTLISIDGHSSYVTSCAFSSNSKCLATASNDNTVKVWQLNDTSDIMKGLSGYEQGEEVDSLAGGSFSKVAMETWSVEDVCHWLVSLGLAQLEDKFRDNAIDGRELLGLTGEDLRTSLDVAALGHRNKILRARTAVQRHPIGGGRSEPADTPEEFLCPITQEIMKDPVIASDGYTYDRPAIVAWMGRGDQRSPMTNVQLNSAELTPNRTLKMMIQKFLQNP
ncbi:WD repeat, SAM and U-box domain-containing protein 1 isoform X2 [Aplysia californica]|uniref:WD repeat, SAM and U-box domain-containing protein 1 n=1 Tax=Aplysia californica TaxID=6500 RepID=A0ABM0JEM2_APLCA|nr:WD repeat, SAM and U-box domain-containing protein 1 isoform X2 [Aplysia californica]